MDVLHLTFGIGNKLANSAIYQMFVLPVAWGLIIRELQDQKQSKIKMPKSWLQKDSWSMKKYSEGTIFLSCSVCFMFYANNEAYTFGYGSLGAFHPSL